MLTAAGGSILLAIVWLIPANSSLWPMWLAWTGAGVAALGLGVTALSLLVQGMAGDPNHGLFLGTLHRSMIPILAAAIVALSLLSRPVLRASEAAYLRQDTLLLSDGAFTSFESRVATARLRGEMLAALDALEASK